MTTRTAQVRHTTKRVFTNHERLRFYITHDKYTMPPLEEVVAIKAQELKKKREFLSENKNQNLKD